MVLKDVQTDRTVFVDVAVVDLGGEGDLGWLEGIVSREFDLKIEDASIVRRIPWSREHSVPGVEVLLVGRPGRAGLQRAVPEVLRLFLDSPG